MKLNSFDKVKQLTEEMVAIPSINKEPGGESAVARYIQDFYMSLPYFQAHPEQVKCFQTKNDFVVRHSTLAYVKGTKGNSNRTVILIGHIDTVGVDDFGTIREYAFRCDELPAKLRETFVLPQEVIDDIESGEYLFGRGALDMKSGVAGHMIRTLFVALTLLPQHGHISFLVLLGLRSPPAFAAPAWLVPAAPTRTPGTTLLRPMRISFQPFESAYSTRFSPGVVFHPY